MLSADVALSCRNLVFGYSSGDHILKGTSLDLRRTSLSVLFGRSVSGKSTLLRCLANLSVPTSGVIERSQRQLPERSAGANVPASSNLVASKASTLVSLLNKLSQPDEARGRLFADRSSSWMMFADDRNLLPHLSAYDNLDLMLAPSSRDLALRRDIVDLSLEMMGLTHVRSHLPNALSTGQLRRVQLGQSLLGRFDVLLLDEPTAGLDSTTKYDLLALTQQIHLGMGLTGLVVTHDIETALLIADRLLLFADGVVIDEAPISSPHPRNPEDLDHQEFRMLRRRLLQFLQRDPLETAG